jgi:hypothetical protein
MKFEEAVNEQTELDKYLHSMKKEPFPGSNVNIVHNTMAPLNEPEKMYDEHGKEIPRTYQGVDITHRAWKPAKSGPTFGYDSLGRKVEV